MIWSDPAILFRYLGGLTFRPCAWSETLFRMPSDTVLACSFGTFVGRAELTVGFPVMNANVAKSNAMAKFLVSDVDI